MLVPILLFIPVAANAQAWLPDRDRREGPGFKIGDSLLLHPGAVVEGGYDTNPLRVDKSSVGAGRLRLSSYVDIATRDDRLRESDETESEPSRKFNLRGGLAGYYDFFFAPEGVDGAGDQNDFGINLYTKFILFPMRPYNLLLNLGYERTMQPYESAEEWHGRHTIAPEIGFTARPNRGTLTFNLTYAANFLVYEESMVGNVNNKVGQDVRFKTFWKMLPKTAIITLARFSPVEYLGKHTGNVASKPVRASVGARGLISQRFGMSLFIGYGASFYERGDDFEGVIASGEVMYYVTPTANVRLGGQRDFVDSFYANFYTKSGGYLKYEQMFLGALLLSAKSDVNHRKYATMSSYPPGAFSALPQDRRSDVVISASLLGEYRIASWVSVMLSLEYEGNISDFTYNTPNGRDPVKYQKFEIMGGCRVHY